MTYTFKDFKIKPQIRSFIGDKISITKVINTQITVLDFKIEDSKKKPGTQYMTLQIEKSGEKRIVFTSSIGLMSQINQVPKDKFPFTTVVVKQDEHLEFT